MEIDVEVKDGPPITGLIKLKGLIETPQARLLRGMLDEIEAKGVGRIIFDMSGVSFVSSTGFSLLVSYANGKRNEWGENPVVLAGVTAAVQQSMSTLGITGIFTLLPDMKSALDSFGIS